jgi:hypothetical protein
MSRLAGVATAVAVFLSALSLLFVLAMLLSGCVPSLQTHERWWPPERANATDRVSAVSTLKNLLEGDAVTTSKLDELDAYAARAIEHYDAQRRFSEASGPLFEAACEAIADFTTLRTLIVRNAHV